ncbi:MAG: GMC family oxidoreductase [Gammaproteobacteria bacterium]|nr:GMC family oxidoreductase [Gammaproteobacteria bacterium]MDH5800503.1 GMC family oxidoreductase [Gammaproteobacteria bacterium]
MTQDIHFDVIVIGSGFGGAVSACRLAQRGLSVCVLERGRRWKPQDYPRSPQDSWLWSHHEPEKRNGWIDLRVYNDMAVAQGSGVGGGSLIYANVSIEAQPFVFQSGWPEAITYESLKPYYEKTGEMLNLQTLPDNQLTERYKLMQTAATAAGYGDRFTKVPLAVSFSDSYSYALEDPHNEKHSTMYTNAQGQVQGTCIHCGNCDIGCSVQAKNTLDLNYLPLAEKHGAEILPLHLVRKITPKIDHYRVDFDRIDQSNERLLPGHFNARKVVVAAGTMGTNELLLKCRDDYGTLPRISRQLGYGWSCNGDFVTPAFYPGRDVSPTRGPTVSAAIDFLDGSVEGQRFFIEDGGFPDMLGNALEQFSNKTQLGLLFSGLDQAIRNRDSLSCIMPWFGQGIDAADGRLHLRRSWWPPFKKKMDLDWNIEKSKATIQALINMHKKLAKITGGTPCVPPSWNWFKDLATPHPMGGCRMADSKANGVVDHKGEVYSYPGLYVADGSILPRSIGLNPSRTIAALAERIAEFIS